MYTDTRIAIGGVTMGKENSLDSRIAAALNKAGISTEDARVMSDWTLARLSGMGIRRVRALREYLRETEETVVVTRHPALVDFLREQGIVRENTTVLSHATPEQVRGKHVIGVLPHWLSAETSKVTEVSLDVPAEFRGRELNLEEIRRFFTGISTYEVHQVHR